MTTSKRQNEEQVPPERIRLWPCSRCQEMRNTPDCDICGYELIGSSGYTRDDIATTGAVSIDNHLLRVEVESLKKQLAQTAPVEWSDDKPNFWENAWKYFTDDQRLEMCAARPEMALAYIDDLRNRVDQLPIPVAISVVETMRDEAQRLSCAESGNLRLIEKTRIDTLGAVLDRLRALSPSVGVGTEDARGLDRLAKWLEEMRACEGGMCMHCIDLLIENIQPLVDYLRRAATETEG